MLGLHLVITSSAARMASSQTVLGERLGEKISSPATRGLHQEMMGVFSSNPFASQNLIATLKTMTADLLAQTKLEGKSLDEVDRRRTAVFMTFGCIYLGGVQYVMYKKVFPKLFDARCVGKFCNQPLREKLRNKEGIKALLKQNMTDMIFNQPLLYFPAFYIVKEALTAADEVGTGAPGHYGSLPSLSSLPVSRVVSNALDKYRPNMVSDVATMSMFWFPANFICYSIPIHFRLPAIHAFSLAWTSGLSAVKAGDFNTTTQNINMQKTEGNHQRTPLDKGADRLNLAWTSMSN